MGDQISEMDSTPFPMGTENRNLIIDHTWRHYKHIRLYYVIQEIFIKIFGANKHTIVKLYLHVGRFKSHIYSLNPPPPNGNYLQRKQFESIVTKVINIHKKHGHLDAINIRQHYIMFTLRKNNTCPQVEQL